MKPSRFSVSSTDCVITALNHHDTLRSASSLPSVKKPNKLTPLEKKKRDRLRMKEQSQRRKQVVNDQYDHGKRIGQKKVVNSAWHQRERLEEELVLRRLERDAVDVQRSHPASGGYFFQSTVQDATTISPVFVSYSCALCPPSQDPSAGPREVEYFHPACHGYAMAKHDSSSCISPVFFFSHFAKISLNKVVMEQESVDYDESDEEDHDTNSTAFNSMIDIDRRRETCSALKVRQQENQRRFEAALAARDLYSKMSDKCATTPEAKPTCLVCKNKITPGCPGCFTFSVGKYLNPEVSRQSKTPKTLQQENEDVQARHKALQKRIINPSILPRLQQPSSDFSTRLGCVKDDEMEFYSSVLPDNHAIRVHRSLLNDFVTLHVKSLPVGQLVSLRVDLKSSVSYLYELYRANTDLPNRPLHLLLPTTHGLFYLNEQIEPATYTTNGIVNGELLLEDFNLQKSTIISKSDRIETMGGIDDSKEFLLFAVAILHPQSTPQLVLNYVQQNFRFQLPDNRSLSPLKLSSDNSNHEGLPQWTQLVSAAFLLPKAVAQDQFQNQIRLQLHAMHVFAKTNCASVAEEERQEREQAQQVAHHTAKVAKLDRVRGQQTFAVSNKVRRALAYFKFVCESTNDVCQPRVAEERLSKLWQFVQLLEEWKILRGGRLLDAERTNVTLSLLENVQETAASAFSQMLFSDESLTDKGGGTLPYPVLCLESGSTTRKLVVRLGTRLGVTQEDDHCYGIVLDLDHDFDALGKDDDQHYTKSSVFDHTTQSAEAWTDVEWRSKGKSSSTIALLVSSVDILTPPFHRIKWQLVVKAYKFVWNRVPFVRSKLDEFNALAKVLQTPDAVLSKAQLTKWQTDVDRFHTTLHEHSALALAVQRVLIKKGAVMLKRRDQARRKQLREREMEMQRLQELQLERERPKLTLAQQLKVKFMKERAPKLREALELTPAEKLGVKAVKILGKAAEGMVKATRKAKQEYTVRTL